VIDSTAIPLDTVIELIVTAARALQNSSPDSQSRTHSLPPEGSLENKKGGKHE